MLNPENSRADNGRDCRYEIDATGLKCPMPLLKMKQALNKVRDGETLLIKVTDPASERDFKSYIQMTAHRLEMEIENDQFFYWITKQSVQKESDQKNQLEDD